MSIAAKEHKTIRNFKDTFWMKIRDELQIFVILEQRPKKILKLYELGEEDVNVDRKKVRQWSADAETLVNEIMENGYADFICNREHIREVFKQLHFVRLHIDKMDEELLNFSCLEVLNLNQNLIVTIENVPQNLKELHLFSNHVSQLSTRLKVCDKLLYLGLGYNQLKDIALVGINRYFPQLVGLDVSNNFLEDIELVLENVQRLKALKMFSGYGNPISLLPGYKQAFVNAIADLQVFDNRQIEKNEKNDINQKQLDLDDDLVDAKTNMKRTLSFHENRSILTNHQFKLRIAVNTLENLPDGLILDRSSFPKFEEKPEYFQTTYFCIFETPQGSIDSRAKVVERMHRIREQRVQERLLIIQNQEEEQKRQAELLIQQQQQQQQQQINAKKGTKAPPPPSKNATKDAVKFEIPPEIPPVNTNLEGRSMSEDIQREDDVSRLDMQIDFEEIFQISCTTRDFFRRGMIVRLYKSEPVLLPESTEEDKQPKINPESGLPVLVETLIGIFRVEMEQFLKEGSMARIIQYKYPIFKENIIKIPEFFFQREDELQQLKTNALIVQKMLLDQEEAEKPPEPEVLDPKKKDLKKKEVKKADKKAPVKKGAKEEPEKKSVPLSIFPTHPRQQIFVDKKNIFLSLSKLQMALLVQIVD